MDHDAAVNLGAPERYVTGDLSETERDEFETHFADCRPCMNDVWTASAFAANARAVFEDRLVVKPEPQRAGWLAWLRLQTAVPAFAAVVFAVVAGYQARVTIPAMRAPQEIAAAVPLDDATRSAPRTLEEGSPLQFRDSRGAAARNDPPMGGTGGRIGQDAELRSSPGAGSRRAAGSPFPGQAGPGPLLRGRARRRVRPATGAGRIRHSAEDTLVDEQLPDHTLRFSGHALGVAALVSINLDEAQNLDHVVPTLGSSVLAPTGGYARVARERLCLYRRAASQANPPFRSQGQDGGITAATSASGLKPKWKPTSKTSRWWRS